MVLALTHSLSLSLACSFTHSISLACLFTHSTQLMGLFFGAALSEGLLMTTFSQWKSRANAEVGSTTSST